MSPTRAAGAFLASVLLAGAPAHGTTPIADLIKDPARFANTTVTIDGTVTSQSIRYLGDTAYTVQGSDDHRITVFGRGAAPGPGTHLGVTGKVGYRPPDEEFSFPPVILESSRETK